ncbi:MAG: M48 family metalloprotease [Thermoplasmata archaeon]|nr:MAG: M48 family metalloprotease [Thermoplasmata archaeon]
MFEAINCYFSCIVKSSTNYIIFSLFIGAFALGMLFLYTKKPHPMFLSQIVSGLAIVEGFRLMTCPMSGLIWIYLGLILGAMIILGMIQVGFDRYVRNREIKEASFLKSLSRELGCEIFLLDTQKIRAFTHKRQVYLSVGLVELLDPEEIKAVAAHELYHVMHTPSRFIANILAVSSLWLRSYRDDFRADNFAAELVGKKEFISALKKLRVKDFKRRARRLVA